MMYEIGTKSKTTESMAQQVRHVLTCVDTPAQDLRKGDLVVDGNDMLLYVVAYLDNRHLIAKDSDGRIIRQALAPTQVILTAPLSALAPLAG